MAAVRADLNQKAKNRMTRVTELVNQLPSMLSSGCTPVEALRLLVGTGDSWKVVCLQIFRDSGGEAAVAELEAQLALRAEELREFDKLRGQILVLDDLCDLAPEAQLTDQAVIKNLLQQDTSGTDIIELCTREAVEPGRPFHSPFFTAVTQHIQLETLERLSICRDSLIFQAKWETIAKQHPGLQLSTWQAQMWQPLLADWTRFRAGICEGTINVDTVRDLFRRAIDDGSVTQEVRRLAQSTPGGVEPWVDSRGRQIADIRTVDRNVIKGQAILEAAAALKLDLATDAEFTQLQTTASQDYGSKPLADLGDDVIRAFQRIDGISEQQAGCVRQLARWPALIKWMRPYRDTSEFETFTSLANAWVEEADEIQLMADLHTVRTGCRLLLYEVDADSTFEFLVQACSDEALNEPALEEKIENCAQQVDKLEDLQRKSQEDVEGTSLVQAKAVYETGTLHVVTRHNDDDPVIVVRYQTLKPTRNERGEMVTGEDGELVYQYEADQTKDYDYCKDLRSKLMLVSGGSDTEEEQRVAVERFVALLEAGEGIVEMLSRLQDAGCLAHATERFEYTFRDDTSVATARTKRSELARSYDDWLKRIDELRARHYALNVFTIVELTYLIRLGRTDGGAKAKDLNRTLALLQCVSKQATFEDARRFCDTVAANLPKDTVLGHESTGEALEAIGVLLTELAARETITREDRGRSDIFSHFLKESQVNCLVGLTAEETLSSILSIYKPNLPRSEQVVLCAETTTAETVKLLFRRCLSSDRRTFCLADVQKLSYETQVSAVDEFERLHALSQSGAEPCQFRLVLIAQKEDTHLCTALKTYTVPKDGFDSETRMTAEQRTAFMQTVFRPHSGGSTPSTLRVCSRAGDGKSHHVKKSLKSWKRNRSFVVLTESVSHDHFVKQLVGVQDKLRREGGSRPRRQGRRSRESRPQRSGRGDRREQDRLEEALRVSAAMSESQQHQPQAQQQQPESEFEMALRLSQAEADAQPEPRLPEPDQAIVDELFATGQQMGCDWTIDGCKRAAVNTANDYDEALQWCFEHAEDADFNEPMAPPPPPRPSRRVPPPALPTAAPASSAAARPAASDQQLLSPATQRRVTAELPAFVCEACTLENVAGALRCAVCETPRPAAPPAPSPPSASPVASAADASVRAVPSASSLPPAPRVGKASSPCLVRRRHHPRPQSSKALCESSRSRSGR